MQLNTLRFCFLAAFIVSSGTTWAHSSHQGGLQAKQSPGVNAEFDIVHAKVSVDGNRAHFHMATQGQTGSHSPKPTGELGGSEVFSYVWPSTINPAAVGFARDSGLLALAVTIHPDFDDTPLFDENRDSKRDNDGDTWHSHWVVLAPNEQCGEGALGVVDIPESEEPPLPATWPGLPILIDSPGWQPVFTEQSVDVHLAFSENAELKGARYDAVTAALRVNESIHAPLLCVVNVFDVASGDLSLPTKVERMSP